MICPSVDVEFGFAATIAVRRILHHRRNFELFCMVLLEMCAYRLLRRRSKTRLEALLAVSFVEALLYPYPVVGQGSRTRMTAVVDRRTFGS